ncbi:AbrB family transcriptional regulator [Corynebacterium lowii]|uniref:Putative ammonia monooxygenase n=1 Tax=Corynebacterium lowii TaxID=1544413 RepID=A0A0Q0ZAZ1_9CORY|nr:AbrB family transcriptional regulator [Corynebacterium lowii]KQB87127.1 putative ammonia monooxygenase [Corynebacterium lowii]MDP9852287.1 membrane AbrB-like protein [Corynebacterium lowii]
MVNFPDRSTLSTWSVVVPLSVALGALLSHWQVPAAWIVAAIVVSSTCALWRGRELHVNTHYYRFGRGIIGIMAGLPLVGIAPSTLASYLVPGVLFAVITLGCGVAGGMVLARARKEMSRETAVLAMLPGGASTMPIMAQELGADYRFVALTQYLRLLIVSMTLPVVAHLFTPPAPEAGAQQSYEFHLGALLLTLLVALGGDKVGKLLRLPASGVLGPLLLTVLCGLILPPQWSLEPPPVFAIMAFLSIGWICGGGLSVPALRLFAHQLPTTVGFIVGLMVLCAGAGWLLARWVGATYFEGYLATTPGALETVLALSHEDGAGAVVVAMQMIRLIAVFILAGWLPAALQAWDRWRGGAG